LRCICLAGCALCYCDMMLIDLQAYKMSLRGTWERMVPVGGPFSGLVAIVHDRPDT
jgi:hypothetical protein